MNKTVIFSYKRDSLPHSEYQVRKQLNKFLKEDKESFTIYTSTASIFRIVRAFCHQHSIKLLAEYERQFLLLDKNMRMESYYWRLCPDLTEEETDWEILLNPIYEKD